MRLLRPVQPVHSLVRVDTAATSVDTEGDFTTLITDASGRLHCNVGNTVTVASHNVTNAGTFAVQAAQSGTWNITNVSGTVSLPTGAATAAKQPALGTAGTASTDVLTVQGIASMTALKVDGSAVTQPVSGTVTAELSATDNAVLDAIAASVAGTLTVGSHAVTNAGTFATQAAQSGTWTVDLGATDNAVLDAIAASVAGTLTVGSHAVTNAGTFAVQPTATTSGGWTPGRYIGAAAANEDATVIKASAGQLGFVMATNVATAVRYIKFYNLASGATSASTPVLSIGIPGNTAGAGFVLPAGCGVAFSTGISFRLTTGMADNDANAITANDVLVSYGYA